MKYILSLLPILLIACSKPSDSIEKEPVPEPPVWIGTYLSTSLDTSFVSQNGDCCKIEWSGNGNVTRLTFDSVSVATDLSFTDNETLRRVIYTPPYFQDITCVGSGTFATNSVAFHFVIAGNGHIVFNGVKKN